MSRKTPQKKQNRKNRDGLLKHGPKKRGHNSFGYQGERSGRMKISDFILLGGKED
jgi:hypothetical protein